MLINAFDLYLANRIQEKGKIDLNEVNHLLGKSASTIRRSVQSINQYLPTEKQFQITDSTVISQLSYNDYADFIRRLPLKYYSVSFKERVDYFLVQSFLHGYINLTQLYDELGISVSTKKKDRQQMDEYLAQYGLIIQSQPGKGVIIVGDEQRLRILVCRLLLKTIEIDENNNICQRQANNPLERKIYAQCQPLFSSPHHAYLTTIENMLINNDYRIGYISKKFIYLYYLMSIWRIEQNKLIEQLVSLPLPVTDHPIFVLVAENRFINALLCSLDYNANNPILVSHHLQDLTHQLIDNVETQIITKFYAKPSTAKEMYSYLYKTILRNALDFDFYDNKLDDTHLEYPKLYQIIKHEIKLIEQQLFKLNENQIATLTLIFRNHIFKNKLFGRNRKKIAIVTNSAKEKAHFFAEQLTHYVDVEIIDTLHINELYRLNNVNFDYLITFSNRIATILREKHYPVIKINYYLNDNEVKQLLALNFSSSAKRKLLADDFCAELNLIPIEQRSEYLKQRYSHIFI